MNTRSRANRNAFTLVELLVVIAIIGILAAIILTGFHSVTDRAHHVRAASDCKSINEAFLTYKVEYKRFPLTDSGEIPGSAANSGNSGKHAEDSGGLVTDRWVVDLLRGEESKGSDGRDWNRRNVSFLDLTQTAMGTGTGEIVDPRAPKEFFVDPWNQPYKFKLDANRDQKIQRFDPGKVQSLDRNPYIYAEVIAWSTGPDGIDENERFAEDDIVSW